MMRTHRLYAHLLMLLLGFHGYGSESMERKVSLYALATNTFHDLRPSELQVITNAASGSEMPVRKYVPDLGATKVESDQSLVRSRLVEWLCTDPQAMPLVSRKGLSINGAHFRDQLDIKLARIPFMLMFLNCRLDNGIDMQSATIKGIELSGCTTGSIIGDGARIEDDLKIRHKSVINGYVKFTAATVGRQLVFMDSSINSTNSYALDANSIHVGRGIVVEDMRINGQTLLNLARIEGGLFLSGSTFNYPNTNGHAFRAKYAVVNGPFVLLDKATLEKTNAVKVTGEFSVESATVSGQMHVRNATFSHVSGMAFNAFNTKFALGDVTISNATFEGVTSFHKSEVRGDLHLDAGLFTNVIGVCLQIEDSAIQGSLFIHQCQCVGAVDIRNSDIREEIEFRESGFVHPTNGLKAILADGVKVGGSIYFDESTKVDGAVSMFASRVDGDVSINGSSIVCVRSDWPALIAEEIIVGKDVTIKCGVGFRGKLALEGSRIAGNLFISGGTGFQDNIRIDISKSRIGTLWLNEPRWGPGTYELYEAVYLNMNSAREYDAHMLVDWLEQQYSAKSSNQSIIQCYEVLADALYKQGRKEMRDEVMIAKEGRKLIGSTMPIWKRGLLFVYGVTASYGYNPWRPIWIGLGFTLLGTLGFWCFGRMRWVSFTTEVSHGRLPSPSSKGTLLDCFLSSFGLLLPAVFSDKLLPEWRYSEIAPKVLRIIVVAYRLVAWGLAFEFAALKTGVL